MNATKANQKGTVLLVSLLILLVLTLIGVTGARVSILQERMTGNVADRHLAFQAAESALRQAEAVLSDAAVPAFDGTGGFYPAGDANRPSWAGQQIEEGGGAASYNGEFEGVSRLPEYYVEQLPQISVPGVETEVGTPTTEIQFYRITARGFGARPDTVVVVRSVYRP
ncbi:hypothetical protein CAI21_07035 [Alkalilimnicola ehrlichii]|uniref:Type IV pilus assembly protein PilX n=1 Tax=Alkalilimnicola ehrlichii TaxID=351052 RepID=A0A3E0WY65_9GAMM|nr:PilX N-terminal domain-containing pilus assembly protein [Alkalilimnicola ehrlichii]RFA30348.1 hypothetical protein CAI21_07035 [Alkalilimnicola ehrlichii]RFA37922.1 hypothetical protein CAL65_08380 [Alkalilimnicola ehrlichii]